MKRLLILLGSIIILILLVVVWAYVMFFGTPESVDELLTDFNFGDGSPTNSLAPVPPDTGAGVSTATSTPNRLRQLTTRPVVGFRELVPAGTGTSTGSRVRYVEAGTGHIYEINLDNAIEERLSGTTVFEAFRADFSADGQYVVIQSGYGTTKTTTIGTLGEASEPLRQFTLSGPVTDFQVTTGGELLYAVRGQTTSLHAMTLPRGASRILYTLPFRDVVVVWGDTASGPHLVYPKPSYLLEGYLYELTNGRLKRLPLEGYGLTAVLAGSRVAASGQFDQVPYESLIFDTARQTTGVVPAVFLPEKCAAALTTDTLWCAVSNQEVAFGFPDSWYRGDLKDSDSLVKIEVTETAYETSYVLDLLAYSGRLVDAVDVLINSSEDRFYFKNRYDGTLWMYALNE